MRRKRAIQKRGKVKKKNHISIGSYVLIIITLALIGLMIFGGKISSKISGNVVSNSYDSSVINLFGVSLIFFFFLFIVVYLFIFFYLFNKY